MKAQLPDVDDVTNLETTLKALTDHYNEQRPVGSNITTKAQKSLAGRLLLASLRPLDSKTADYIVDQLEDLHQKLSAKDAFQSYLKSAEASSDNTRKEVPLTAIQQHADILQSIFELSEQELGLDKVIDNVRVSYAVYGGTVRDILRDSGNVQSLLKQPQSIDTNDKLQLEVITQEFLRGMVRLVWPQTYYQSKST